MKIREITLYAVVNKRRPKLDFNDLFQDKDVKCTKDEMIIPVTVCVKSSSPKKK